MADLWGRLRQSSSFTAELSRRFEETLQQQFRSMKGSSADALAKQLDFLAVSQKKAEVVHAEALAALQHERESGRRRFEQLVEQLKGVTRIGSGFGSDGDGGAAGGDAGSALWGGNLLASPVVDRHASTLGDYSPVPGQAHAHDGPHAGLRGLGSVSFRVPPVNPVTSSNAQSHGGGGARVAAAGSFRVRRAGGASVPASVLSAGVAMGGAPPSPAAYRGASSQLSDLANRLKSPR